MIRFLVLLAAILGAAVATAQAESAAPNVVVILADDMGYGDPGCFNPDSRIPTPNLDRLAAEGMRFTDAHSGSAVCTPTRYGLLTGRYAWRTRLERGVLWGGSPHLVEPRRLTLPRLLKQHGYRTAGIGKWHLGMDWASADGEPVKGDGTNIDYGRTVTRGPRSLGFDVFFGIPASLDMPPYCYVENDRVVTAPTDTIEGTGGLAFFRGGRIAPDFAHRDVLPTLTRRAVAFIDEQAERARNGAPEDAPSAPFFLYFALPAPHTPVLPNDAFIGRSAAGPYGDFVVEVDDAVGQVLAALERNGLAGDTLVIVTSDNGSTMTRASTAEYGHRANHVFRGRKSDAWEGGHRVPFIARWPGVVAPGTTCDAAVGLNDLFATCADVVAAELPGDAGEDSISVLPALRGASPGRAAGAPLVHHSINGTFAIRDGRWKLILARGSGGWSLGEKDVPKGAPPAQLYDLDADPSETTNLYDAHPDVVARLTAKLAMIRASGRTRPAGPADSGEAAGAAFASAWPAELERHWIGPEYHANRLQDWRVANGRLECVEASEALPLRTVHLLTRAAGPADGTLTLQVRTGAIDEDAAPGPRGWTGFLIGAGGDHVDYRLSALVHHKPAEDGGLLAIMDDAGIVAFRDNARPAKGGGGWAVRGPTAPADVPVLAPAAHRILRFGLGPRRPFDLRLDAVPEDGGYTLTLTARDAVTGRLRSEAVLRGVDPARVDGSLALVSHLGPEGSTTGHWFEDWRISGTKLVAHDDRAFGPVLGAMHTLSDGTLKMTAQFGPLGGSPSGGDARTARLEVRDAREPMWHTVAVGTIVPDSWTCTFRVENWDGSRDVPYRIAYELRTGPTRSRLHHYAGTVRAIPDDAEELVLAAFTGHKIYTGGLRWNENGVWFPHRELVDAVRHHDPDFLFFSGDQIYEGDLTPVQRQPPAKAMLDYLSRWYRWCWAFGELTRDVPAVAIPDDHDVYHGNLWGAGGRAARARDGMTAQDSGGYTMPPAFVNAVHRTQTAHLPDPVDPAPVEQDISVYFTRVEYAGLSFAVIADRQWKSSATVMVPEGKVVNGWFQNPDFDPAIRADVPGAVLLGDRQLRFLDDWAADWSHGAWMKVALSQTIFANVATIPAAAKSGSVLPRLPALPPGAYPRDHKLAADTDSNGWPQTGRNEAVRALRRARAVHVAGDQHLGTTIQYGVDAWRDAGYALCVPSVANTWPRRWFPPEPDADRAPGAPPYTGDFRDGFGNLVTVYAASNPFVTGREPANLHDRAPGYGIVRFDRRTRDVTIECWPRGVDPAAPGAAPYEGWPVTFNQLDHDARAAAGRLPAIDVTGMDDPVVQVIDETSGQIESTVRIAGTRFRPTVLRADATYTLRVGDPDAGRWWTASGLPAGPRDDDRRLSVVVPAAAAAPDAPPDTAPEAAPTPATDAAPPNVVFILVDDLGYGDLACYGSPFNETPNIDRLAAEGLRFTSAYANAPNCAPTRACLMTGQYPPRHGIYTVGSSARGKPARRKLVPVKNTTTLADAAVTLPETLARAGYVSASIGKWHLGPDPLAHGFDVNVAGTRAGHPRSYFSPYDNRRLADGPAGEYLTDRLTDEAIRFLRENRERPFFLYLTHYAVHTPIQAKPDVAARYRRKMDAGADGHPAYAAMIESVDDGVGRVLATLAELGLDDRTVVVFFSDNGGQGAVSSMGPLRGAKGMLYEGGLRVPMIVRWPGRVAPGTESDVPVAAIDFFPTILQMAGLPAPAGTVLDGASLVPLLTGGPPPDRAALFWHFPCYLEGRGGRTPGWRTTPARVVRRGRYKLLEFFEDGTLELYDLVADPGERRNLAAVEPDVTSALHAALLAWSERVGAPIPSEPNPRYDPGGADD